MQRVHSHLFEEVDKKTVIERATTFFYDEFLQLSLDVCASIVNNMEALEQQGPGDKVRMFNAAMLPNNIVPALKGDIFVLAGAAAFRDDVKELNDLKEGMVLDGVVTNVAAFGAFVDIGVHKDGLVHVSHLGDPNCAVKVGEFVKVKVLAVDAQRKRISLSIREAQEEEP